MKESHIRKMQLGRKAAYLRRCILAMQLCEKYESETTIRKRVFEKNIKPILDCSYTTFNNMLNERNPVTQLSEIYAELGLKLEEVDQLRRYDEAAKPAKKIKQLSLFEEETTDAINEKTEQTEADREWNKIIEKETCSNCMHFIKCQKTKKIHRNTKACREWDAEEGYNLPINI